VDDPDSESGAHPSWISAEAGSHDETLTENWLFRLRRERFQSRRSGKTHDYYVTHLADGVQVIPVTPDERVVLVRQFRAGSRRDSLEVPGGLLEPGEDPCSAGARELLEETGFAGSSPVKLGKIWPNPALLTMQITTIVISNARAVADPQPDHAEELSIELVRIQDVRVLIKKGTIDHAVSVAGLLWWLTFGREA
jgi:8-oxo-dGTP pyrophosphatase MutT (NUDIX family)